MRRIPIWAVPLMSASIWLLTLLTMLGYWASSGRPVYSYINKGQTIPFISDVAAQEIQPVFIGGSLFSVILLNISLILKHRRTRAHINLMWEKDSTGRTWSCLSILITASGSLGLVLLALFDRLQYPGLHRAFLTLYVAAFSVGAAVACLESLQICIQSSWRHRLLRVVLILRLCTAALAATLGLAFWYAWRHTEITRDFCAVIEWVLGITFTGHVACFASDLLPSTLCLSTGEDIRLG